MPDPGWSRRAAALLRATANDLKREDAAADAELGLPPGTFADCAAGRRPVDADLLRRAAAVWPVNERDLLPVHDDCPDGLRICRAAESAASSRLLDRGDGPYYEYRDTAMSRVSSYRPEWIRMLRVVADDDPANPAVRWNSGHLLYQFTYFVGPVNYYCGWDAAARCIPMHTGDSVWGQPFAAHSFTARSAGEPAYILALTYGGGLGGDAQRELAVLGPDAAGRLALPVGPGPAAAAALLRSLATGRALPPGELAARAGLAADRTAQLLAGLGAPAGPAELAALAGALGVGVRDLLPPATATEGGVRVCRGATARRWAYPDTGAPAYRLTELAGDPLHPHTAALAVEVLATDPAATAELGTYQHQYLYVLDGAEVRVDWEHAGRRHTARLAPGDSGYLLPAVPVRFSATGGPGTPRLLLLRTGGAAGTEVRAALGAMADGGIARYVAEDRLWFARKGPDR